MNEIIFGLLGGFGMFFFADRILGKRLSVRDAALALVLTMALVVGAVVILGPGLLLEPGQRSYMDSRLLFWCTVAIGYSSLSLLWGLLKTRGNRSG